MKRKKICFISTSPTWGGGENWQIETILAFKDKAEVISISNPKGDLQKKVKEYVEVVPFGETSSLSFLNPLKMYRIYKILKRLAPDAIMFNASSDFKLFTLPARWAGVKKILYRRDNGKALVPHFINKYMFQKGITLFLPCSKFILNSALSKDEKLIPEDKIAVVYNSISLKKWDSQSATPLCDKENGVVYFGCIGRLSEEKGLLFLPDIVNELKLQYANFKILIAGTGYLEEKLKAKIKATNTEEYFEFLGFVNPSKNFMETIDCLLLPSLWEGLPTVAIEAMASSKPVISFEVAGNPEVVRNNETGFTVPAYDTAKFTQAMTFFLNPNEEKIKEMQRNGRALVEKVFCREVTDKQLETYLL